MSMIVQEMRAPRREAGLATLILGVFLAWLLLKPGDHTLFVIGDNVGLLGTALVGAAWCVWGGGGRRPRGARPAPAAPRPALARPRPPLLLGLGLCSQAVGAAIWLCYAAVLHQPVPFPSWADAGWLGGYPFWLLALLLLPRQPLSRATRAHLLLDGLMIITALATVSWFFILGPVIVAGTGAPFATLVTAAYPFADLLLLACLVLFPGRSADVRLRPALAMLTLGLSVIAVTDSLYTYKALHGLYAPGDLIDGGWVAAWLLLGLGARALRRAHAAQPDAAPTVPDTTPALVRDAVAIPALWRALLPYALVPALGALVVYSRTLVGDKTLERGLSLGAMTLLALVVAHQALVILENRQLYTRLRATHGDTVTANAALAAANTRLEDLWVQATTDPLTSLPNHRTMVAQVDQELERAQRYRRPCALLVLDLDHFKAVNDGYGHLAGDTVLRELAAAARGALRGVDSFSRWGGEEFVALLPETDTREACDVAERVRACVAAHPFAVGGGLHLTCSIGVAVYPVDAEECDGLVAAADGALYAAKCLGRNQVRASSEAAVAALESTAHVDGSRADVALTGMVEALATLVAARDQYTGQHTQAVAALAVEMALALGLAAAEARMVGVAGWLHDIGKVAVPDAVLQKPGRLTAEEWAVVQRHPGVGAAVVSLVPGLRTVAPLIGAHHERWDGRGYPDGVAGAAIPLGARIVSVANAYAAMISARPYRPAGDMAWSRAEVRRGAGTRFDPTVVTALERVLDMRGADVADQRVV